MSTLETNLIQPATGTTLTVGASGDTVNFPTGVTVSGLNNTPAFFVFLSSGQSLSDNTMTKVAFDSESFDTDNAFASNKFTVPSSKAGKYLFTTNCQMDSGSASNGNDFQVNFYKNGSSIGGARDLMLNNPIQQIGITRVVVIDLSVSDYIEVFAKVDSVSGSGQNVAGGSDFRTSFSGFKLI